MPPNPVKYDGVVDSSGSILDSEVETLNLPHVLITGAHFKVYLQLRQVPMDTFELAVYEDV